MVRPSRAPPARSGLPVAPEARSLKSKMPGMGERVRTVVLFCSRVRVFIRIVPGDPHGGRMEHPGPPAGKNPCSVGSPCDKGVPAHLTDSRLAMHPGINRLWRLDVRPYDVSACEPSLPNRIGAIGVHKRMHGQPAVRTPLVLHDPASMKPPPVNQALFSWTACGERGRRRGESHADSMEGNGGRPKNLDTRGEEMVNERK